MYVYSVFKKLNLITPKDHSCYLHTTFLQFYSFHNFELIGSLVRNFFKSRYKDCDLNKKFGRYFEPSFSLRLNNYSEKFSSLSIDYKDADEFRIISKALLQFLSPYISCQNDLRADINLVSDDRFKFVSEFSSRVNSSKLIPHTTVGFFEKNKKEEVLFLLKSISNSRTIISNFMHNKVCLSMLNTFCMTRLFANYEVLNFQK